MAPIPRPPAAPAPPWWNTRAAVAVVGVAAFLATFIVYCPTNWIMAAIVLATDGMRTALWIAAAAATGAALLRAIGLRPSGGFALASAAGAGLGLFGLIALGLGLLGWLNRATALAMPIAGVAAYAILLRAHLARLNSTILTAAAKRWLAGRAGMRWLWIVVVISLATATLGATVMPGDLWKPLDPHPYDVTSYHLQVPREWYESGKIVPLEHNVFSYFPFNVEMQYLLLMEISGSPWRGMYSCQLLSAGYTLLMVLAVGGMAGESGDGAGAERRTDRAPSDAAEPGRVVPGSTVARRDPAATRPGSLSTDNARIGPIVAAAMVAAVPWVIMLGATAYVESALMLYTALSLAWTLRALRHGFPWRDLAVAGAFAGLAAGVKITAVPMLILGVSIAICVVAIIPKRRNAFHHGEYGEKSEERENRLNQLNHLPPQARSPSPVSSSAPSVISVMKSPLPGCAIFLAAAGILLAPWLLRNIAWAGNPLFPVAMRTLGHGHFSPDQVQRFVTAHSPTPTEQSPAARLAILWNQVLANWQYGYLLLPAAIAAACLRRRQRDTWLLLIVAASTLITWIGFTHLLSRFLVMLIPTAGLLLAEVQWKRGWPAGVALAIAAGIWGQLGVLGPLSQTTRDPDRSLLIGLEDLSIFVPRELTDMWSPDKSVGLVGDAGAFLYQMPMNRLHYRTVFDLPGGQRDPIAAWVGPAAERDPNYLLVINPMEIARLHATYRDVPALPAKWAGRERPFVIRGGQGGGNPNDETRNPNQ